MSKKDIERGERLILSPEMRRQIVGSKVNPLFTRRPYWCTNYGELYPEVSKVRTSDSSEESMEERL